MKSETQEQVTANISGDKEPESEHNLVVVVGGLIACVAFVGIGGGVAFPTLPTLGTVLGISPFVVGVILSANSFTRLTVNTPVGRFIDQRGTRLPAIFGVALCALGSFGYIVALYAELVPLFGATEIFIASRVVWGLGSALVYIGAFSTIIHITSESTRGKWVGYFRGGQALGFPSGLILGGIITDLFGYAAAFGLSGVAGIVGTVIGIMVFPPVSGEVAEPISLRRVPRVALRDRRIVVICIVNFTVRLTFAGILLSTIVLYLKSYNIGVGSFSAVGAGGLFLGLSAVWSSLSIFVSGNLSDHVENRAIIAVPALVIFAIGFLILGTYNTFNGSLLGVSLIGIGVGGTNPPLLAFLGDISAKDDIGKIGGVYNTFGDIGSTLGPLAAIPLAAFIGYQSEYLFSMLLVILTLVLVLYHLILHSSNAVMSPISDFD